MWLIQTSIWVFREPQGQICVFNVYLTRMWLTQTRIWVFRDPQPRFAHWIRMCLTQTLVWVFRDIKPGIFLNNMPQRHRFWYIFRDTTLVRHLLISWNNYGTVSITGSQSEFGHHWAWLLIWVKYYETDTYLTVFEQRCAMGCASNRKIVSGSDQTSIGKHQTKVDVYESEVDRIRPWTRLYPWIRKSGT